MRLVLYQPDIAQNVGATIRSAACFGADMEIIEPCGFPLDSREIKRVAMDYGALAAPVAHTGWTSFLDTVADARLILLTTKAEQSIWDFSFEDTDVLLFGRESAGAPAEVHEAANHRLRIPLAPKARSLNLATTAAIVLAETRRQLGWQEQSE